MLNVYNVNIKLNLYTQKKKIDAIYLIYTQLHTSYLHVQRGCNVIVPSKKRIQITESVFLAKETPKGLLAGIIIVC